MSIASPFSYFKHGAEKEHGLPFRLDSPEEPEGCREPVAPVTLFHGCAQPFPSSSGARSRRGKGLLDSPGTVSKVSSALGGYPASAVWKPRRQLESAPSFRRGDGAGVPFCCLEGEASGSGGEGRS